MNHSRLYRFCLGLLSVLPAAIAQEGAVLNTPGHRRQPGAVITGRGLRRPRQTKRRRENCTPSADLSTSACASPEHYVYLFNVRTDGGVSQILRTATTLPDGTTSSAPGRQGYFPPDGAATTRLSGERRVGQGDRGRQRDAARHLDLGVL